MGTNAKDYLDTDIFLHERGFIGIAEAEVCGFAVVKVRRVFRRRGYIAKVSSLPKKERVQVGREEFC